MNGVTKNCSLILYPEKLKLKEGYLLGINLTEFVVVVLDVIEYSDKVFEELKKYANLTAFKQLVKKLVSVTSSQSERNKSSWVY